MDEDGKPYITKEQLCEFIKTIMMDAEEFDAWDDKDFDDGYCQIDKDRGGTIDKEEFVLFIKRFADL